LIDGQPASFVRTNDAPNDVLGLSASRRDGISGDVKLAADVDRRRHGLRVVVA
jgi:hypothetical protein